MKMKDLEDKEFEELQAQYRLLTEKLSTQKIVSEQVISEATKGHINELKKTARKGWYFPLMMITSPLWALPMVVLLTVPFSMTVVELMYHHRLPDYGKYFSELVSSSTDWSWMADILTWDTVVTTSFVISAVVLYLILALWQSTLIGRLGRMQNDGSTPAEIGRYARDIYQQFHSPGIVYLQSGFMIFWSVVLMVLSYYDYHRVTALTIFWLVSIVAWIILIPVSLKRMKTPGLPSVFGFLGRRGKKYFSKSMDYHLLQIMEEMETLEA